MCTTFQVSVYIKIHSFLIDIVYCMYVHIPFSQYSTKVNLNRFQCLLKTRLKQKLQHVFFYFKKIFQVINFVEPFLRIVGSKSLWHFYKNWLEAWRVSHSVVSDSLWPHGLYPTKFLCPWDSLGRNTGVSSHSLLQGILPSRDWTQISCIAGRFFIFWATREACSKIYTYQNYCSPFFQK